MVDNRTKTASVIIVAAGEGKRFGSPKTLALIKGCSVLIRSLQVFDSHPGVFEIILVLRDMEEQRGSLGQFSKVSKIVLGGRRRQDSVVSGFREIDPALAPIVLVHDAVRPLVTSDLIDRVIEAAAKNGAAVPVIPVCDTIKRIEDDKVSHTLERSGLFRCQTPQGFSYEVLKLALSRACMNEKNGTDEASFVEAMGHKVWAVAGDPKNIKITVPADLKIAEALFED